MHAGNLCFRFQYFAVLPDASCTDWPSQDALEHVLFKGFTPLSQSFNNKDHSEDLDDIPRLRAKLKVPATPPDPATISPAVQRLHITVAARYVGAGSLISLKTPQEGFMKQAALLKDTREGYQGQVEKVYRLSGDQQAVFQGGLRSFVNFGGHGSGKRTLVITMTCVQYSGKTLLMEACIARDAQAIFATQDSSVIHRLIICIWQKGADALIKQYKQLESTLPKKATLEVVVMIREEMMKIFRVNDNINEPTTYQINNICKNISQLIPEKEVHLYIDECWITVSRHVTAHLSQVSILHFSSFPMVSYLILRLIQTKWSATYHSGRTACSTPGPSWTRAGCSSPWQ
jgi:hypothetical protein